MRFAFLVGGCAGFLLAALSGFLAERPADLVFRDAAIACLAGGFLFRWFWSVVVRAFLETAHERRKPAATENSTAPGATPAAGAPASQH